jgi:hypothetical protein
MMHDQHRKRKRISAGTAARLYFEEQQSKHESSRLDEGFRLTASGRRWAEDNVFSDLFHKGRKREDKLRIADTYLANVILRNKSGRTVRATRNKRDLKNARIHLQAVDELTEKGWIMSHAGYYDRGTESGRQTRYTLSPQAVSMLVEHVEDMDNFIDYVPNELIVLRDENKRPIPIPENLDSATRRYLSEREYLITLCNFLNGQQQLTHRVWEPESELLGRTVARTFSALKAVYNNGSFKEGGRLYGEFQNLRKTERSTLQINGQPTVELDYSCLHPQMLYNIEKRSLKGDAYEVFPNQSKQIRNGVKIAFNALLNSQTEQAALKACNLSISDYDKTGRMKNWFDVLESRELKEELTKSHLNFKTIMQLLKKKHAPIAKYFGTGFGLLLQNMDVELVYSVCSYFAIRGIPALPVHDSFIIQARYESELREIMHDSYHQIYGFSPRIH